jgi:hypothetical protein
MWMLDRLYELDLLILFPVTIIVMAGSAELGAWIRRRFGASAAGATDFGTMTGAALGLLALLLAFSFSLALSRYDARRTLVLEEANAIGSTANFALMLPQPAQASILALLRDYAAVRIGLGVPFDPEKLERDVDRSLELQNSLWQQAVAVTAAAPQSLPAYRFAGSLNEINNIHESRLTALRYHVPGAVMFMLVAVAVVAMVFSGYQMGLAVGQGRPAALVMSITVALVIMLVADLDRPARGMVLVPVQALVDAARGIPP